MILPLPPYQVPSVPQIAIVQQVEVKQQEITIPENGSLTSLAAAHQTTVQRLWEANLQLDHPDRLTTGNKLLVPYNDQVLNPRPMPVTIVPEVPTSRGVNHISPPSGGFSYTGNTYYVGQCVWYVKNQLSWVQNGWGNASDWKYTSGHTVSTVPIVGSVAWAVNYGHVAIVESIGASTVQIREMNYTGVGVESRRQAPISEFEYIYP